MTDKDLDSENPKNTENSEKDAKNSSSEPEKYVIELEADAGEDAIQNALDNFKQFATDRGTEMARIASEMARTEMAKHEMTDKSGEKSTEKFPEKASKITSETQSSPKSSPKTPVPTSPQTR